MSDKEIKSFDFNFIEFIEILWKHKMKLIILGLIAIVVASIFSAPFFIKPKFKSTAVFYPTTNNSISNALLTEINARANDPLEFGEEEEAEKALQILQSSKLQGRLIRNFELKKHYNIKKSSTPNTMVECDSDMENCVDVPRCNEIECRTTLDCRVDNVWYDLSGWRKGHPGGEHWIDYYDGRDATEVMYAFHSDKAMKMMQKLPKSDSETVNVLESIVGEDSSTAINFRKLREVRLHNDLLLLVCEKRNNFFDFNPLRRTTRALSTTTESLKGWVVGTGHCS